MRDHVGRNGPVPRRAKPRDPRGIDQHRVGGRAGLDQRIRKAGRARVKRRGPQRPQRLVADRGAGHVQGAFGHSGTARRKGRDAARQAVGQPQVVLVAEGKRLAGLDQFDHGQEVPGGTPARPLADLDLAGRMGGGEAAHDLQRAVGRSVVRQDQTPVPVVLPRKTVELRADEPLPLKGGQQDRDAHAVGHAGRIAPAGFRRQRRVPGTRCPPAGPVRRPTPAPAARRVFRGMRHRAKRALQVGLGADGPPPTGPGRLRIST